MKNWLKLLAILLFFLSCEKEEISVFDKPNNFTASKAEFSDKISLTWDEVNHAKSYQVFRLDPILKELKLLGTTNELHYIDSGINSEERIFYKMRAYNSDNSFGIMSDSIYGYTTAYRGNDPPSSIKVSKGDFQDKIQITWRKTAKGLMYELYKLNEATNEYNIIAITSDTIFIDNVIPETFKKYFYKVRALNTDQEFSAFTEAVYGYTSRELYDLVGSFGSRGYGSGQFQFPSHLSIDGDDNIYVSDVGLNNIQKFDSNGNFIEVFYSTDSPRGMLFLKDKIVIARSGNNLIRIMNYDKTLIREWGGLGAGSGQFSAFRQITTDDEGFLYVVDHNNGRVQKFNLNGEFMLAWNVGTYPWGIAYVNNKIMVSADKKIKFYSKQGEFIKEWNTTTADIRVKNDDIYLTDIYESSVKNTFLIKTNENRDFDIAIGKKMSWEPVSVDVASDGRIFVLCSG